MAVAALVVALVALFLALAARGKAAGFDQRIDDLGREGRRRAENAVAEMERELATTRRLLAELAAGRRLDPEQVLEGRLWRDVDAGEGKRLVDSGEVRLIDVRTPAEAAAGMIPGALHIPVDEIEARKREVPRDGRVTLIYCAGGARSAAACEFLSGEGWTNLLNLEGGFQSWSGPVERPQR
jgi:rhodanese-related sulfurtransferase